MAEVLHALDTPLVDETGARYRARVVGRQADDGMWEGWLEFAPAGSGGEAFVTGVESRQPKRSDLVYWATGLTAVYADGAFQRARHPAVRVESEAEVPVFDEPARPVTVRADLPYAPEAVLDPFEIAERSVDILRQELHALNRPRLLNIIAAYDLNTSGTDLSALSDHELMHFIAVAVEARLANGTR